jgi:hypothetical protein
MTRFVYILYDSDGGSMEGVFSSEEAAWREARNLCGTDATEAFVERWYTVEKEKVQL